MTNRPLHLIATVSLLMLASPSGAAAQAATGKADLAVFRPVQNNVVLGDEKPSSTPETDQQRKAHQKARAAKAAKAQSNVTVSEVQDETGSEGSNGESERVKHGGKITGNVIINNGNLKEVEPTVTTQQACGSNGKEVKGTKPSACPKGITQSGIK